MLSAVAATPGTWYSQRLLRPSAIYRRGRKTRWSHRYGIVRYECGEKYVAEAEASREPSIAKTGRAGEGMPGGLP